MAIRRSLVALAVLATVACSQEPERVDRTRPHASVESPSDDARTPSLALSPLDEALLRQHTAALAADTMDGRRPGTPGARRAVSYIQAQMEAMGVEPAGEAGGWTQTVPMRSVEVDVGPTSLILRFGDGESRPLVPDEEVVVTSMGPAGSTSLDAPLVFVGYGITAPEYDWDDYADVDLRDKVAVVLVGDPPVDDGRFDGPALTYYGRWTYKFERAREAGAAGCLLVHETKLASYDWTVVRNSWSGERFGLRTPGDEAPPRRVPPVASELILEGWVHRDLAKWLAASSGRDLPGWHALALAPDFRPFPIGADLVATVTTTETTFSDVNIVGRIPGRTRPDEVVVVTAHWDHLGIDPHAPPGQDAIFNGAIDNASGVAGLLGLAAGLQARVQQGRGPGRSVLLLATTAEEQGLLGSRYFAERPLVPRASIVAAINLDSMNVEGRTTTLSVTGPGRSTLEDELAEVAAEQGRTLVGEPHPEAGAYFRSDHFSFARVGVPALDVHGGPALEQGGLAAGEALARRRARRYHTVGDEFDERWPFTGALQDVRALLALIVRVADAEERPRWKPGHEPASLGTPGSG